MLIKVHLTACGLTGLLKETSVSCPGDESIGGFKAILATKLGVPASLLTLGRKDEATGVYHGFSDTDRVVKVLGKGVEAPTHTCIASVDESGPDAAAFMGPDEPYGKHEARHPEHKGHERKKGGESDSHHDSHASARESAHHASGKHGRSSIEGGGE